MPIPLEIRLSRARDALVVRWQDGATDRLPAAMLRRAARDAGAVRAVLDGAAPAVCDGLTIVDVRPVGTYAVNLFFSDGHDRGIYPWSMLHALGRENNATSGN
jgi:DUF971 family protein